MKKSERAMVIEVANIVMNNILVDNKCPYFDIGLILF